MRTQVQATNFTANGQVGPWLYHDIYEPPFNLTLAAEFGSGLAATLAIDYAIGDFGPNGQRQVFISQAATTATITDNGPLTPAGGAGHGLAVGDIVNITQSPGGSIDGIYVIATVPSGTTYTVTTVASQTLNFNAVVATALLFTSAANALVNVAPFTARTAVGVGFPIFASRLHVTAFTTGGVALYVAIQGGTAS